jgi:hypothetical protein
VESIVLAVDEFFLNGKPNLTSGATALVDDVLKLDGECVKEPGEHDIVHLPPVGKSGGSDVGGDMVIESVVLQRQQDEVAPAGRSGWRRGRG